MSKQAFGAFREKVNRSPELQQQVLSAVRAVRGEGSGIVALGKAHGCEFTVDEAQQNWTELTAGGGELSDFELEVVAAGSGSVSGDS